MPEDLNPYESPVEISSKDRVSAEAMRMVWGITTVLLVISTLAVVYYPGLGIIGYLITIPGMIYGLRKLEIEESVSENLSSNKQLKIIVISFLLMIPVVIATSIAFVAICVGTVLVTLTDIHRIDPTLGYVVGIPVALLIHIFTVIYILPKNSASSVDESSDLIE